MLIQIQAYSKKQAIEFMKIRKGKWVYVRSLGRDRGVGTYVFKQAR